MDSGLAARSMQNRMLRVLPALVACLVAVVISVPLTQALCDREAASTECEETDCKDSGCEEGTAAGGCAQCGHFGKMIIATIPGGAPIRSVVRMHLFPTERTMPEGYSPSIDQPPRAA
jgi:hypothetical protein